MKGVIAFVTGNSRVTLPGVVLAAALAIFTHQPWAYAGVLLVTLAASAFERV